jgi:hypothetical protein
MQSGDDAAPNDDAMENSDVPIVVDCMTWSATFFAPCDLPSSSTALVLDAGNYVYNTDTDALTDPNGQTVDHDQFLATSRDPDLRIIVAASVQLAGGSTLRVTGTLPFAIAAWQTITIAGVIDVGARGPMGGPSSRTCAGITEGQTDTGGGGGGGAGGFGGAGAAGGMGDLNGPGSSAGGTGGPALTLPTSIVGGCAGAKGGDGDDLGGVGGAGGGAIAIAAAGSIDVSGTVRAGGGGGNGGVGTGGGDSGGGGGGAGGMIVLESPSIDLDGATLAANGGGGGEGSESGNPGAAGQNGLDATTRAAGGTGGTSIGADGGTGGALDDVDGSSPTEHLNAGGGGGGGGAGFIIVRAATKVGAPAVVSPGAAP